MLNQTQLTIGSNNITLNEGLYSLNDLHKASGDFLYQLISPCPFPFWTSRTFITNFHGQETTTTTTNIHILKRASITSHCPF